METNLTNLTYWQKERISVMKKILSELGDEYILKGGTALMFFYGLNRFSEDIDLDARGSLEKVEKVLQKTITENQWQYRVTKNTDIVFRMMIDYGGKNDLGNYPLKLEVSGRNKKMINGNVLKVRKIKDVSVYDLSVLASMKLLAFAKREKIRDFYDIAFLVNRHSNLFSDEQLFQIKSTMEYKDLNILVKYLNTELSKYLLVKTNAEELVLNTYVKIEDILITRNQRNKEINIQITKNKGNELER